MLGLLKGSKRLLLIKLRYIGDSIWMWPVINNLKWNYPHLKLSVLVNEGTEAFFYINPLVDEVIPFPRAKVKSRGGSFHFFKFIWKLRKKCFDTVIDLTDADRPAFISFLSGAKLRISYDNEHRPRRFLYTHKAQAKMNTKHMVDYHLDILRELGLKIFDSSIKIELPEEVFKHLKQRFPTLFLRTDKKKRLLIHPGARTPLRQWGVENFAELGKLVAHKYHILLIGGKKEKSLIENICQKWDFKPLLATTKLNLLEFAGICRYADIFLGNDTAPLHIAAAMDIPVIGIYGPTLPQLAAPWTDKKIIFEGEKLPCRPCRQDKCVHPEFKACLKNIKPEAVAQAILKNDA